MAQTVNVNFRMDVDLKKSMEQIKKEIDEGKAHFAEHDLIEVDD